MQGNIKNIVVITIKHFEVSQISEKKNMSLYIVNHRDQTKLKKKDVSSSQNK